MNTTRIWLLRLVLPGRYGRVLTGILLLVVLLAWFAIAGVFRGDTDNLSRPAAVFFCVILAYVVPVFHFITEQTLRAFDQLTPQLEMDETRIRQWRSSITHKSPRWILGNTTAGLVAWFLHTSLLFASPTAVFRLFGGDASFVAFALGPALVWVTMLCVVGALIENAVLFRRLAAHVRIDLLEPAGLTAFARVAVISTLALVGAQASFPIMWLDAHQAMAASLPGLLATGGAMVFLFVLPIWPIHRQIVAAKRAELARVGALLANARSDVERDGVEFSERVARLNPYLVYRREIARVSEWPFDSSIATRLAFYLVIPPLTWLGAAIIDVAVERLL